MDLPHFIAKWRQVELTERSASQQHFLDLCEVVGHPKPAEADPKGEWFTFERGVTKRSGHRGWADVWKKGFFAIEYKGRHKDLDAAYDQLLLYRSNLENPPLLAVCDMGRMVIHTNFTGTIERVHDLALEDLPKPGNIDLLRSMFHDPGKLRPDVTREVVTIEVAEKIGRIARDMQGRGIHPFAAARFLDRVIFCLFAEDVGLLPKDFLTRLIEGAGRDPRKLFVFFGQLFRAMANGGNFGADDIHRFNGDLFDQTPVVLLNVFEINQIREAARLEWDAIDPSIFGSLFERGMDPEKRSQLGAHYTSRADIEAIVDPVVMRPLREEWDAVRRAAEDQVDVAVGALWQARPRKRGRPSPDTLVRDFLLRLQSVTVLDPACGSGNFLYVALQKLKDLEKEVLVFAADHGLPAYLPLVGPWQLHGIEANAYAFELAQLTVWIGYLQWMRANGYRTITDPILSRLDTFRCKDSILDLGDPANPRDPEWPAAEFIVGNPPFLGGKRLRAELGDAYVDAMFRVWRDRVRPEADLCCYWFEKARALVEAGKCRRAGLLATQGIRGGASRETLKRIKQTGDIFFAESDRNWILDGATVHVSMVGFDAGDEASKVLDGRAVAAINSDLTATAADVTTARRLAVNLGIAFMGDTKGGAFDIAEAAALEFLRAPNPDGRPNSDVVVPWINGLDVTRRNRNFWIIDFGVTAALEESAGYELPFEYAREHVLPERQKNNRRAYRDRWWIHVEARPAMRHILRHLPRFIVTTVVSKHRLFAWIEAPTLPDHQLFAFARDDDYFLGVLHSRPHEVWARSQGTQVRERESGFRYTATTCLETFPFPEADDAHKVAIAAAAKALIGLRTGHLDPPEWTTEEVLEFPGSSDGPWARFVHDPDRRGIGTVRYPRRVPRDAACAAKLARRTLTNLYNDRPTWLDLAHRRLDDAVAAVYGWPPGLPDEEILSRLLAMNLGRAPA